MRLVCLSDTHGHTCVVPDGDVLVVAGDMCQYGTLDELADFAVWVRTLPHPHKLIIAGNHDWCFQRTPDRARALLAGMTYLQDTSVVIDGVRFYGSPWQPEFCGWAFNVDRGPDLARIWAQIPEATHVLVTHGPARGILDGAWEGPVGDDDLLARLPALTRLRAHICGHIHGAAGVVYRDGVTHINAAICNEAYEPVHHPRVIDLVVERGSPWESQ